MNVGELKRVLEPYDDGITVMTAGVGCGCCGSDEICEPQAQIVAVRPVRAGEMDGWFYIMEENNVNIKEDTPRVLLL